MEKIVEQGMLYDFYGELLTEHQRKIYEDVVLNDMSLSEIAEEQGISRQGVHDLVRKLFQAVIVSKKCLLQIHNRQKLPAVN